MDLGRRPRGSGLAEREQRHIRRALKEASGNQVRAAALLDIHRNTIARMMRKYGIKG